MATSEETKISIPVHEVTSSTPKQSSSGSSGIDWGSVVGQGIQIAGNMFNKNEQPKTQTTKQSPTTNSFMNNIQNMPSFIKDGIFDLASQTKGTAQAAPLDEAIRNTYGYNKPLDLLANETGIKSIDDSIAATGIRQIARMVSRKAPPDMTKFEDNDFVKTMDDIQKASDVLSQKYPNENLESLVNKAMGTDDHMQQAERMAGGGPIAMSMGTQASAQAWGNVTDYLTHKIARGVVSNAAPLVAMSVGRFDIATGFLVQSGVSAAGAKYAELRKNAPDMKEEDRVNNAVMTGALQFIMQKVALNLTNIGAKIIDTAGVNIGSTIIRNSILENLKDGMGVALAKVAGIEIAGNTLNAMAGFMAQTVLDNVYKYNVQSWKDFMYGLIETGVISAAHGLILQTPVAFMNGYRIAMKRYQDTGDNSACPSVNEVYMEQALSDIYGQGYKNVPSHVLSKDQALAQQMLMDGYKAGAFSENLKVLETIENLKGHIKSKLALKEGYVRLAGGHSTLEDVVNKRIPNRATPEQILRTLEGAGVPKEEVQDMDLFNWLKDKETVSKKELQDYLEGNDVQIQEARKKEPDNWDLAHGDKSIQTKFGQYQLPGGENYREVLLTLPSKSEKFTPEEYKELNSLDARHDSYRLGRGEPLTESQKNRMIDLSNKYDELKNKDFKSSHWEEPNVLAHFRLNDRTIDGKKTLFIEEIQSDWHQKGREKGYAGKQRSIEEIKKLAGENTEKQAKILDVNRQRPLPQDIVDQLQTLTDEYNALVAESRDISESVQNAPFKKTWHELALKRILKMAVDEGYDKIAWTTGEQQAERYDLSKQVDKIKVMPAAGEGKGKYFVEAYKDGEAVIAEFPKDEKELASLIGKDLAQKAIGDGADQKRVEYSGESLKVGGEGMKGFYDQIIPAFLNKYTKKWGGRVGEGKLPLNKEGLGGGESLIQTEAITNMAKYDWKGEKGLKVHTLDITPFMKKSIMKSQPIYGTQARSTGEEGFARIGKGEGWEEKPEEKERKFVTQVKASDRTADKIRKTIEAYYTPITNKDTLAQAHSEIEANREQAINEAMDLKSEATALSNAKSIILAHQLQKEGKFDQAINIIEVTAAKATELGQAVQALSLYSHLTPEGVLVYAQRKINEANKEFEKRGEFDKRIKLSKDKMEELQKLAEDIKNAKDDRDRIVKSAILQKKISEFMPPSIWQKISTVQTMGQLLNVKTSLRNLIGNIGFQSIENIKDSVATGFDMFVSGFTGIRTKTNPDLMQQWKSLGKGWEEGYQDALYGINTGQSTKFDFANRRIFTEGVLGKLEQTLNITLRAPDRAFYKAAHDASLTEQMKTQGVKFPTDDMLKQAHLDGLYRTFQDDSALARIFTRLKKALNAGGEFGLGDFVIKYPKTPANIISRGIEYTPLNFVNTVWELGKLTKLGKLIKSSQDKAVQDYARTTQKKASESFGRALTGSSMLVGSGYILSSLGLLTGTDPKSKDKDLKALEKEIGLGKQKVNTSGLERFIMSGFNPDSAKPQNGDIYATYDWFQPQAINIALGANLHQNKGIKTGLTSFLDALLTSADTIIDQPLFTGIRKLFGFNDPVQGVTDIFKDMPASFVPTFLSQTAKFIDNTARNTADESPFKEAMNRVQYKIPYWSGKLEPRITIWGEDEKFGKDQGKLGRFYEGFIAPYFTSKRDVNPEAKLALDIWLKSGIKSHFPQVASRKQTIVVREHGEPISKTIELDPRNYVEFQRYIGNKTGVLYKALSENQAFLDAAPDDQAKYIQSNLTDIVTSAKILYAGHKPKRLSKKAKKLAVQGAEERGIQL